MASGDDRPDLPSVLDLDSATADIAGIRRWTRSVLPQLQEDDLLDVLLVVNELVSNVYDHAAFPARLLLHRSVQPFNVKVVVEDASAAQPVISPSTPDSARGRGLALVDQLSKQWGVVQRAAGKSVWAVVGCTTARTP